VLSITIADGEHNYAVVLGTKWAMMVSQQIETLTSLLPGPATSFPGLEDALEGPDVSKFQYIVRQARRTRTRLDFLNRVLNPNHIPG
jgi:hypothetical protein